MILGIYYLTLDTHLKEEDKVERYFLNFEDAITALDAGVVELHSKIGVRDEAGTKIVTTPGRIIFNQIVSNAVLAS